jgi:hypothetical protein
VVNLKEFDVAYAHADEIMRKLLIEEFMKNPALQEEITADVERIFREFLQRRGIL